MKKLLLTIAVMTVGLAFGITADAQTQKIGMTKARAIAAKQAAGKIESSELENEAPLPRGPPSPQAPRKGVRRLRNPF